MIESTAYARLCAIGLSPALRQRLSAANGAAVTPLRVTEVQREGLTLHDGDVERPARMLPALRAALAAESDALAVGDWVHAERNAFGEWWVHARLPPLNQLARRLHDGRDKVTRVVIVSNVDTALLVMGLDHDYNLRRLERYVALVLMAGVGAVVVLTKRDLVADAVVDARLSEVREMLPAGVEAVAVDALGDEPRRALAPWLAPGLTLVMLGSSGAGKSTLTNALTHAIDPAPAAALSNAADGARAADPGVTLGAAPAAQATGANRSGDSHGRHTTTSRSLHTGVDGACIIDTPGLRTLRLDGAADDLGAVFDDIAGLALRCRFRDCGHEAEPGCAVRDVVAADRLRSYHKLLREARRDSVSALERKAQVQQWKARGRDARVRSAAKRG